MTESSSKLWNVKDFIQTTTDPKMRLQSLRIPRDLSLGGTKIKKKNYIPNLNTVRNKEKTKEFGLKETKQRKRNNSNQAKHKNERFFQTEGVFSEGIGFKSCNKIKKKESVAIKESNETVTKEYVISDGGFSFTNINKSLEKNEVVLEEPNKIQSSSDLDSEDEKCPFMPITWPEKYFERENNIAIKQEDAQHRLVIPNYSINSEQFHHIFRNNKEKLTMWKLPDLLPFKKKPKNLKDKKVRGCNLSDLPNGQIGKILVRKSGKFDIYIGNVMYQLEANDLECASEMEMVVAVDELKGMATVMGEMEDKFHLTPNWESFLK